MEANVILWWAGRDYLLGALWIIYIIGSLYVFVNRINKGFDRENRRILFTVLLITTLAYEFFLCDTRMFIPVVRTVLNYMLVVFTAGIMLETVVTGLRSRSWEVVNFYSARLLYAMVYIILCVFLPADMEMETISAWLLIPFAAGLAVAAYNSVYIEKHKQGALSTMAGHVCTFIYGLLVFFIIKFNLFP